MRIWRLPSSRVVALSFGVLKCECESGGFEEAVCCGSVGWSDVWSDEVFVGVVGEDARVYAPVDQVFYGWHPVVCVSSAVVGPLDVDQAVGLPEHGWHVLTWVAFEGVLSVEFAFEAEVFGPPGALCPVFSLVAGEGFFHRDVDDDDDGGGHFLAFSV